MNLGGWNNTVFKTRPLIWHFNGGGKPHFGRYEKNQWFRVTEAGRAEAKRFWSSTEARKIVRGQQPPDFRGAKKMPLIWKDAKFEDLCPKYAEMRKRELSV
jgi:hypothetical protein